jgi:hypothetical protein
MAWLAFVVINEQEDLMPAAGVIGANEQFDAAALSGYRLLPLKRISLSIIMHEHIVSCNINNM